MRRHDPPNPTVTRGMRLGSWTHRCPLCGAWVNWALAYCAGCSWRQRPRANPPWGAGSPAAFEKAAEAG